LRLNTDFTPGFKKPGFFKKKPNPVGFLGFIGFWGLIGPTQWVFWVLGFYWVFLDNQEKIGKIIQKLSNLKP